MAGKRTKSGVLQMLFQGGSARALASDDNTTRHMKSGLKPGMGKALFAGGAVRSLAREDLRMDHEGEDADKPHNLEMLSDGGEAGECSEECLAAAEDIMDVLGGGFYGDRPSDSDNKVERASKEASRRAKAKMLADALKAFFLAVDED